jgi:hypothetical protein
MGRVSLTDDVLGGDEVPAVGRPAAVPAAVPAELVSVVPVPVRKFTMLNGPEEDARARQLTDDVVRLAGVRPTKGMRADVVRALIDVAAEDPKLQAKVAKLLKSRIAPRVTARR